MTKALQLENNSFSSLPLKPELLATLESIGFERMTPIQAQSLPSILAGKDVIAQGKTGSGKTAAFGLGLLNRLHVKLFRVQTLVLCPTRELADQVAIDIRTLARGIHNIKVLTLCGGVPVGPQIGSLEHGAHIIVGTPGRILEHLEKGRLSLTNVHTLVFDEADRMLEMGFQPALDAIMKEMPSSRQTLLFSATFPKQIQSMTKVMMNQPEMIQVESTHESTSISQYFYECDNVQARFNALLRVLLERQPESAVVFCNTKRETKEVADFLVDSGFAVVALHGDLEQRERDQMLIKFANKSVNIMVATDVAARGLDIEGLDAVVNFHLAHDTEVHIHRIGRTGRAGQQGIAYSFFGHEDGYKIALLEDYLARDIQSDKLPDPSVLKLSPPQPMMATLHIDGGKKSKVRPGDILGALTGGENGIQGADVGKIKVTEYRSYVAVKQSVLKKALKNLSNGKIKGRNYRVWHLR